MKYSFKDELKNYGLNDKEISIYIALLSSTAMTVKSICVNTKIPRTTVIENLERLKVKGLVAETVDKISKRFVAESPLKLKDLILEKKENLEAELTKLKKLDKDFPLLFNSIMLNKSDIEDNDISIKFYKGKVSVWNLYKESLKCNEVYSFCYLDKYYEVYPDTRQYYKKAFVMKKDRKVYDILIDTPLAREIAQDGHNQYYTRFLPKNSYLTGFVFGDYMIFDNKVMVVQLATKHPVAVVIESQDVYLSFKGLHKTMWELL